MPIYQTPEAAINDTLAGEQITPSMTVLGDGRTVVVWATATQIFGRVINADGSATSGDIVLSAAATNAVSGPKVAATADGGFVVVWSSTSGADTSIQAAVFDAALTTGTQAAISSVSAVDSYTPSVEVLANGKIAISWFQADGAGAEAIATTVVAPDLTTLSPTSVAATGAVGVNTGPTSVVGMPDGSYMVSWTQGGDIVALRYDNNGEVAGSVVTLNSTTAGVESDVAMAALASGGFVATWSSDGDVRARIFNADGIAIGLDFVVNNTTAGTQGNAAVTQLADGRLMFVYASGSDVVARIMLANGTAAGDDFVINGVTAATQGHPTLKALADGRVFVGWESNTTGNNDIVLTLVDPTKFYGASTADDYVGGELGDSMYGYAGSDELTGMGGNDYLVGGAGLDTIDGGDGNDKLFGDADNDRLIGGLGNDMLAGGANDDNLQGGDGDDVLIGGAGIDTLNGGTGTDAISYAESSAAVQIDLTLRTATGGDAAGDKLLLGNGIENVTGSIAGADTIIGDKFNNVLRGLGGNDNINGGDGYDTIYGGDGNDTISGGGGTLVTTTTPAGNDNLYGGAGDDNISGRNGTDVLYGNLGADILNGGDGTDTASYYFELAAVTVALETVAGVTQAGAADGDTYVSIENIRGTNGFGDIIHGNLDANDIRGYGGNDELFGRAGADIMYGGEGNDRLVGGSEVDTLKGDNGNDTLQGGAGADKLDGGAGDDSFHYAAISEFGDTVAGFSLFSTSGDVFTFNAAALGGFGTIAEDQTLATTRFQTGTDNVASNSVIRFMWESDTDMLWYDRDGSGSTYSAVMVADFSTTSSSLTANDIILLA